SPQGAGSKRGEDPPHPGDDGSLRRRHRHAEALLSPLRRGAAVVAVAATAARSAQVGTPRGGALARGLEVRRHGGLADRVPVTEGPAVSRLQLEGRAHPRLRAEDTEPVAPAPDEALRVLVEGCLR